MSIKRSQDGSLSRILGRALVLVILTLAVGTGFLAQAQDQAIAKKLQGFDAYMAKILKDWNVPGIGIGIVSGDKLIFAKGYGFRDYEKKHAGPPDRHHPARRHLVPVGRHAEAAL
ncbi:MAG: hypothetical protein A2Y56_15005 [Candidatus Aminicenantes bacterium RBG_13_63_10]|nr:MAG: hypothetical protein A2Y56_15005 [Candidatus Aminicenantes bacterium RBG_13_63_10]